MSAAPSSPPRPTLETLVGASINDPALYRRALTHRSVLRGSPDAALRSNERLEFLGDALIDLVIGEALYHRYPEKNEGFLSRLRAKLVSGTALSRYARAMELGAHLRMSDNAAAANGRENPSILADAFEALTGAVYLDLGYQAAVAFVHRRALEPFDIADIAALDANHKSRLLEYLQAEGRPQPTYRVVEESGPSHDKTFTVEACVDDTAYGQGTAGSKQEAEQRAAHDALTHLTDADDAVDPLVL